LRAWIKCPQKVLYLQIRAAKEKKALVAIAIKAVLERGWSLNCATEAVLAPIGCESGKTVYLPPLEDGRIDITPLWEIIRPTHERELRRYMAMRRRLGQLTGSDELWFNR